MVPPPLLKKISLALACASAVTILISIAVSQILLALALGFLLLSGLPLRWPKITLPLAGFLLWTLIALAFSPDPAFGLAQVRKMIVFLILLIVFSSVRTLTEAKWLAMAWMLVGTGTAIRGVWQFSRDVALWNAAGRHTDFYHYYVADRISGFMSHWMTFSGEELFVLLLLLAFVLYAPLPRRWLWLWMPCLCIVGLALLLSDTRSVWIAAVLAGFYLLWFWRRWAALAMPAVLAVVLFASPEAVRVRARSIVSPEKQTDSNRHRIICWRTGWEMIKAHPLLGVGPDEIRKESVFFAYLPNDVARPLPDGYYQHLHNFYVQYAAERGLPAALLITAALLVAIWHFWGALRKLGRGRSEAKFLLHAGIACILGTLVGGVFEYNLNNTEVLTMFLAITCLGYLAREKVDDVQHRAAEPAVV